MITIRDGDVYQWDSGRQIEVDSDVCEVHFASCNSKDAYVTVPVDGVCNIPNILLQSGEDFVIYAVCQKDECEQTVEHLRVWVKGRAKPSDYVYTETEVFDYKELEERIKTLEQSSGVADLNYESLSNKPSINGVELTGNLSTEDLNIEVSGDTGVSDVTVNGASVVSDGVANIPIANTDDFGVVKLGAWFSTGLEITKTNTLSVRKLGNEHIDNRYQHVSGVVCGSNLDYAVKQAMTDGKGAQWTSDEKASARARMGLEWTLLGDVTVEEEGVVEIDIPIDNPNYNEYQFSVVLADRTDTTNKQILVNFDSLTTNTYALASFNVGTNKNYSGHGYTQRNCNNSWFAVAIGGTGNQQASTMTTITGRANNYSKGATWNTESPTAINVSLATGLDIGSRFVVYAR